MLNRVGYDHPWLCYDFVNICQLLISRIVSSCEYSGLFLYMLQFLSVASSILCFLSLVSCFVLVQQVLVFLWFNFCFIVSFCFLFGILVFFVFVLYLAFLSFVFCFVLSFFWFSLGFRRSLVLFCFYFGDYVCFGLVLFSLVQF